MAELVTNYVKSEELMATEPKFGGIVHTYQKYDPASFPNPSSDAPDLVSPAFEHMMHYGSPGYSERIKPSNAKPIRFTFTY